jgi:hypothetical protein
MLWAFLMAMLLISCWCRAVAVSAAGWNQTNRILSLPVTNSQIFLAGEQCQGRKKGKRWYSGQGIVGLLLAGDHAHWPSEALGGNIIRNTSSSSMRVLILT